MFLKGKYSKLLHERGFAYKSHVFVLITRKGAKLGDWHSSQGDSSGYRMLFWDQIRINLIYQ